MKTLNITFTDAEYKRMKMAKKATESWHAFMIRKCCRGISEKRTYSRPGQAGELVSFKRHPGINKSKEKNENGKQNRK